MLTYPSTFFGAGYLDSVLSSVVFDADATIPASYPGSGQVWFNLTSTPADGGVKSAYDLRFGNSESVATNDPTFTGAAMSFDGGDFFQNRNAFTAGSFMRSFHKTTGGSNFWQAFSFRQTTLGGRFFNSQDVTPGWNLFHASGKMRCLQSDGSTNSFKDMGTLSANTWTLFIVSHSHSQNLTRAWCNSLTAEEVSHTFITTTADSTDRQYIGTINTGFGWLTSGTLMRSFAMGNAFLDNTKAAQIYAHLGARHGGAYA